jgi:hypothetical protein
VLQYEKGVATLQLFIKKYTALHKIQGRFEGITELEVVIKETEGKKEKNNFSISKIEIKK